MKFSRVARLTLICTAFSCSAEAATFDGTQPLICALSDVQMCAPTMPCQLMPVESVDAPHFLSISVTGKTITGTRPSGAEVNAKIELVHHSEGTMFLQGAQEAFSWNLAIDEAAGNLTLIMADGSDGAVSFGACTTK